MAKGQMRGNREPKKPKKDKPKIIEAASPLSSNGKPTTPAQTKRK